MIIQVQLPSLASLYFLARLELKCITIGMVLCLKLFSRTICLELGLRFNVCYYVLAQFDLNFFIMIEIFNLGHSFTYSCTTD